MLRQSGQKFYRNQKKEAEDLARTALTLAVEAFHWFQDITFDYPRDTLLRKLPGVKGKTLLCVGDVFDRAHLAAHRAAELVGGLFGCLLVYDDEGWMDECPVQLMHVPLANSPGMVVRYACNICGKEPGDCPHSLGTRYEAIVSRVDDSCSVCGREECHHGAGESIIVAARVMVREMVMREVSLVERPRDPLARLKSRSMNNAELIDVLGRIPDRGERIWCHGCMFPCGGFKRVGPLTNEEGRP
jgi:hypothetical protein